MRLTFFFCANLVGNLNTLTDACDYIRQDFHEIIYINSVNEEEIISVFRSVNISHSCYSHGMKTRPVLYVSDIISQFLAYIFNICLEKAMFPIKMQIAKVAVIHKEGDKNYINNCTSVSIFYVFLKA